MHMLHNIYNAYVNGLTRAVIIIAESIKLKIFDLFIALYLDRIYDYIWVECVRG